MESRKSLHKSSHLWSRRTNSEARFEQEEDEKESCNKIIPLFGLEARGTCVVYYYVLAKFMYRPSTITH